MKKYILSLFSILFIMSYISAGPLDILKEGLKEAQSLSSDLVGELTLPDYSPLGKRIANGEAVYENTFYWITKEGAIGSTTRGWSRVPKKSRNLVYLKIEEAEKALANASISPEERRASEEEEKRLAAEKKAEAERIASEKKAKERKELENAYSDYVYGTREKPLIKNTVIEAKNEYLPDDKRLYLALDFGAGVKLKAVRGKVACYDSFEDRAFNEDFEDMKPTVFKNYVVSYESQKGNIGDLRYARPLDAVVNVVVFEPNMFGTAGNALAAGGIERCTFTLNKAVFIK